MSSEFRAPAIHRSRPRLAWSPAVVVATVIGAMTAGVGQIQAQTPLSASPACGECSIRLDELTSFTPGPDAPGGFDRLATVAATESAIAVASTLYEGQVAIFDRDGEFQRAVGRSGRGPGEFEGRLDMIRLAEDSLMVVEVGTGRFAVYGPSSEPSRTGRLAPRIYDLAMASEQRLVVSAAFPSNDRGLPDPLALVDREGTIVSVFADSSVRPEGEDLEDLLRIVATGDGGDVWAISPRSYVLENWTVEGGVSGRWTREADWIRPGSRPDPSGRGFRPPTRVQDAAIDGEGRLWVFTATADSEWDPDQRLSPGERPPTERLFDTIVDVYDPVGPKLLATRRLDRLVRVTSREDLLYSVHAHPSGQRAITIWRYRLAEH